MAEMYNYLKDWDLGRTGKWGMRRWRRCGIIYAYRRNRDGVCLALRFI